MTPNLTRPSQPYAKEKLAYVGKYQFIFATGMKGKWSERVYIDLMAGPGRCQLASGEEFDGSPLLSLQAPFTSRVFVEADPALCAALRSRVPSTCVVLEEDANAPMTIATIRQHVPANALGLAFADNLGLNISFETLQALTHDRKIDLVIVFQLQDLTRNVEDALSGQDDASRLDTFFGSTEWAAVARDARAAGAKPGAVADALLTFYAQRLGTIGYAHTAGGRRVMKNSQNATQYRLLLAGKHQKAVEFFRKIEAIDPYGQRSLLD